MRAVARPSKLRCALCHDLVSRVAVRCACGSFVHALCAREYGRCPTLGCGKAIRHRESVRLHASREVLASRFFRRARKALLGSLIAASVVAMLHVVGARVFFVRVTFVPRNDRHELVATRTPPSFEPLEPLSATTIFPNNPSRTFEPGELADPRSTIDDLEIVLSARMEPHRWREKTEELRCRVVLRNRGKARIVVARPWTVASFTWVIRRQNHERTAPMRPEFPRCGSRGETYTDSSFPMLAPGETYEVEHFSSPIELAGDFEVLLRYEVDAAGARDLARDTGESLRTVARFEDHLVLPSAAHRIHRLTLGRACSNVVRAIVPETPSQSSRPRVCGGG